MVTHGAKCYHQNARSVTGKWEEALGNAGASLVKIAPVYPFYHQNTSLPLLKYLFWPM